MSEKNREQGEGRFQRMLRESSEKEHERWRVPWQEFSTDPIFEVMREGGNRIEGGVKGQLGQAVATNMILLNLIRQGNETNRLLALVAEKIDRMAAGIIGGR